MSNEILPELTSNNRKRGVSLRYLYVDRQAAEIVAGWDAQ